MPTIPFYSYYKPQFSEYKPTDLSGLYAKYAELQSKNSKKKDIKLPDFKELDGVGLSNENRFVGEKMVDIRTDMERLANIGDTQSLLMIQDLSSQYRRLGLELQTNKNNKDSWDKASVILNTQQGNNVLVLDKNRGFFAEVREHEKNKPEVITKSYFQFITPKERPEFDAKENTSYKLLTYGELKDYLNNDDRLVRQPSLIEKLTNGMDLNYINKEYISPVFDKVKTNKVGSKNTVGGFQNAAGEVIAESMRGGTTEENFNQLKAATDEVMVNLESAGGGKPWESLLAYAYQMPAKEWIKGKDKKVTLKTKVDASGNPVYPTTDQEARLNIELYVMGASDKVKVFNQETESVEKIDFKSTYNLAKFGNVNGTTSSVSPVLVEAMSLNKNGKLTLIDLSKGGKMSYMTLSTDVPITQEELKKNKGFLSTLNFAPGLVNKAQLEDGKIIKGRNVIIDDGNPNRDYGWDVDLQKKLASTMYIDGKELKLTQIYTDKNGKKVTFDDLSKEQQNMYYRQIQQKIVNGKKITVTPKEKKAQILTDLFKQLGFKADLVYYTTAIIPKGVLKYTDKETAKNKLGKKGTKYADLILSNNKVEREEVDEYITKMGGGDYDKGKEMLDVFGDVNANDFGRINVYIPFNSIGANATGAQKGSWNYKAEDHLGNIMKFDGTNTFNQK